MEQRKNYIRPSAQETDLIYNRLLKASPGDVITYEELSRMIGRNIKDCRGYLSTARGRALSHDKMVFSAVTNVGIKCCGDEEKVGEGMGQHERGRRAIKKAISTVTSIVDFDSLSAETKGQHQRTLISCRTVELFTKKSLVNKIAAATAPTLQGPPAGRLAEMFKELEVF